MNDPEQHEEIDRLSQEIKQRIQTYLQDENITIVSVNSMPTLSLKKYTPPSIEIIAPRWNWLPIWLYSAPILSTFLAFRYKIKESEVRLGMSDE